VVIDPDSRLTQLGLLPVCPEERYCFFESRAYGSETGYALPELASAWAAETFGIHGAKSYVALGATAGEPGGIAINLGVGENPAKRLPDPFEEELLRMLAGTGERILIDKGAGGEEARRVELAVQRSGARATYWEGSFAGFASIVAGSRLYVGYDSAGQHVAAAAGVPLVSVFAGFPAPRMFERWRPVGARCRVIRVERPDVAATLEQVRNALTYDKF
jgi:ADP-heptose:LPS heptosyltransferase